MKTHIALLTAVCLLQACGAPARKPAMPQVTSIGASIGTVKSQEIGPSGGTVASTDGRLAIKVPAGALKANTTLTIQAIEVTAPGAVRAWRLGPEGQKFEAAVDLVVTYGADDLAGSAAEVLDVGYQNPDRTWSVLKDLTLDLTAKTVTAKTTHFSDWSLMQGLQLLPVDPTVVVGSQITLTLNSCESVDLGNDLVSLRAACSPEALVLRTGDWSVNGMLGGSTTVGTITGQEVGTGTFKAPGTKPSPSRVAVSTAFTRQASRGPKGLLVSNITIVDVKGWAGSVSYSANGSKTTTSSGMSGLSTMWTKQTVSTVKGSGTIFFEPGGFGNSMVVTGGNGTWSESTLETTTGNDPQAVCPYINKSITDTQLSGTAKDPSGAFSLATLTISGSTYTLSANTLYGDLKGTIHSTSSSTGTPNTGQSCNPVPGTDTTGMTAGSFSGVGLMLDGTIDPAKPNEIKGARTLMLGTNPPQSWEVTWSFKQ